MTIETGTDKADIVCTFARAYGLNTDLPFCQRAVEERNETARLSKNAIDIDVYQNQYP